MDLKGYCIIKTGARRPAQDELGNGCSPRPRSNSESHQSHRFAHRAVCRHLDIPCDTTNAEAQAIAMKSWAYAGC